MPDFDDRVLGPNDLVESDSLGGSEFFRCTLKQVDFSAFKNAKRLKFFECRFEGCNLANLDLTGFVMRAPNFRGCNLVGVNWTLCSQLADPEFHSSKLDLSSFQSLPLNKLKCIDSSAREVDFYETKLTNADFSETQLSGANFNAADLSGADLRTATDYWIDPTLTKLKGARFSYPAAEVLMKALGVLIQ